MDEKDPAHGYPNHLIHENSPYLLQHAYNPVDWYPWSEFSLEKARKENKLMVISIGYAACHWCHVMERECFEDSEVASAMNTDFISVKVDREERPDIDQVYMLASYITTGRGGWPLNVIALPDGRPVYAGTYFPKRDWLRLLREFSSLYRNDPGRLIQQAGGILEEIKKIDRHFPSSGILPQKVEELDYLFRIWLPVLDYVHGGSLGAPKFLMPGTIGYMLRYGVLNGNQKALEWVRLTLDKIAAGGIYDHLGGGFCRYSVDDQWKIPHFEKMLYDNAQLVALYSEAFRYFRKEEYRETVFATLGFIERELTSPEGLFFSSLDADSEGEEGAFYTWTAKEIRNHLGKEAGQFITRYSVEEEGNWEHGKNILFLPDPGSSVPGKSPDRSREILFIERQKRIHPPLDHKILTSWNALMISGYIEAYRSFLQPAFLEKAIRASGVLSGKYLDGSGKILRTTGNRNPINGFLDDYAFLAKAMLDLYQVTFDTGWLKTAEKITLYALEHFADPGSDLLFYASDLDPALIDRKPEISDNVIPSSNSRMAMNLFILGHLLERPDYTERSGSMLRCVMSRIRRDPAFHANWMDLLAFHTDPPFEVSVVGDDWKILLNPFLEKYFPAMIFSGGESGEFPAILNGKKIPGRSLIYICRNKTCSEPFQDCEEALRYIQFPRSHLHSSTG